MPKRKQLSDAAYKKLCKVVYSRDGWKCRNLSCRSRNNLHAHHIRFRSHGGPDTTENLVTVCHNCHDDIHKRGTLEIRAKSGKEEDTPNANIGLRFINK